MHEYNARDRKKKLPSILVLVAVGAACSALGAAEPEPTCEAAPGEDCASGLDAHRAGSTVLETKATTATATEFATLSSAVSWEAGDATDWIAVDVPAPGHLTLEVDLADVECGCSVVMTDGLGGRLARAKNVGGSVRLKIETRMDGRFHVRVRAEEAGAGSAYTVRLVWEGKADAKPLTPEAKAALHLADGRRLRLKNRAATMRRLEKTCDAAPESEACDVARTLLALMTPRAAPSAPAAPASDARALATDHYSIGLKLLAENRRAAATEQMLRAVELDPTFAEPHRVLGEIATAVEVEESMCTEYKEYVRLAPTAADAERVRSELSSHDHPDCR